MGQMLVNQRNIRFDGDEESNIRKAHLKQGMTGVLTASILYLLTLYIEGIKIDPKDSLEEKQWCHEIVKLYFAFHVSATFPHFPARI